MRKHRLRGLMWISREPQLVSYRLDDSKLTFSSLRLTRVCSNHAMWMKQWVLRCFKSPIHPSPPSWCICTECRVPTLALLFTALASDPLVSSLTNWASSSAKVNSSVSWESHSVGYSCMQVGTYLLGPGTVPKKVEGVKRLTKQLSIYDY